MFGASRVNVTRELLVFLFSNLAEGSYAVSTDSASGSLKGLTAAPRGPHDAVFSVILCRCWRHLLALSYPPGICGVEQIVRKIHARSFKIARSYDNDSRPEVCEAWICCNVDQPDFKSTYREYYRLNWNDREHSREASVEAGFLVGAVCLVLVFLDSGSYSPFLYWIRDNSELTMRGFTVLKSSLGMRTSAIFGVWRKSRTHRRYVNFICPFPVCIRQSFIPIYSTHTRWSSRNCFWESCSEIGWSGRG